MVSKSLTHAVVGIRRVDGIGTYPHSPVRLLLRGDARRFAVRTIVRPTRVPARLPFGPSIRPPSYDEALTTAALINARPLAQPLENEDALIDKAMVKWFTVARTEWSDMSAE